MSYEISATTKLEPQVNQILVPNLLTLKSQLEQLESKEDLLRQKIEEKELYESKAKPGKLKYVGLGFLIFCLETLLVEVFKNIKNETLIEIILLIMMVVPFAVPIVLYKFIKKKFSDLALTADNEVNQLVDVVASELNSIQADFNYIPPNMLFSYAIDKLIQIVQYNRADSWMAALNLLEQEIRMDRMEINQALQNQVMMQEIQDAKNAANAAAVTSGASFIGSLFK